MPRFFFLFFFYSLPRVWESKINNPLQVPKKALDSKQSESGFQVGIYYIISEAAVFVGPIIFCYANDKLHSQRIPFLVLYLCMILGYGLVWTIMLNVKIEF